MRPARTDRSRSVRRVAGLCTQHAPRLVGASPSLAAVSSATVQRESSSHSGDSNVDVAPGLAERKDTAEPRKRLGIAVKKSGQPPSRRYLFICRRLRSFRSQACCRSNSVASCSIICACCGSASCESASASDSTNSPPFAAAAGIGSPLPLWMRKTAPLECIRNLKALFTVQPGHLQSVRESPGPMLSEGIVQYQVAPRRSKNGWSLTSARHTNPRVPFRSRLAFDGNAQAVPVSTPRMRSSMVFRAPCPRPAAVQAALIHNLSSALAPARRRVM